jgi:hypothetical protein
MNNNPHTIKGEKMNIQRLKLQTVALLALLGFAFISTGCQELDELAEQLQNTIIASHADYGDAPDDGDADQGIASSQFPTQEVSNGARHTDTTRSALGYFLDDGTLAVSAELGATDPDDPDGVPNLDDVLGPDQDLYDDGFFIGGVPVAGSYSFPVIVSVAADAEEKTRYINILADWNGDLEWRGDDTNGAAEWVVKNFEVTVAPGTSDRLFAPSAAIGTTVIGIWYRVTLSDTPVDAAAFDEGWDGTGVFAEGETEDYIFEQDPGEIVFAAETPIPGGGDGGTGDGADGGGDGSGDGSDAGDGAGSDGGDGGDGDDGADGGDGDDGDDDDACPADDDDIDADGDPDGDGEPGINRKNIGKMRKIGPNEYKIVLCKGKTYERGFEWQTQVRNASNSNPLAVGFGISNDPGTIKIRARKLGTSTVSFEANVVTFPIETVQWVTGTIHVTVIDCTPPPCDDDDAEEDDDEGDDSDDDADDDSDDDDDVIGDPGEPEGPSIDDVGLLLPEGDNAFTLVLCACEEEVYERGFDQMTRVRNPHSDDPSIATIRVSNDPGRFYIAPLGIGRTTLTFEANPVTFPRDVNEWTTITINVIVIDCEEHMGE